MFARYTQVGLLRLLTNQAAMGEQTLTVDEAGASMQGWLTDPRVQLHPEPRSLETAFRRATGRLRRRSIEVDRRLLPASVCEGDRRDADDVRQSATGSGAQARLRAISPD